MHPQLIPGRRAAARLTVLCLVVGAALAAAPAAVPARAAGDDAPYGRLPVLRRDWQRLPVRPDGTDPVAREQRRQAEVTRRWHLVHDMVGARHVSRLAAERLAARGLGPALVAGGPDKTEAYDGVDTLKVLLVRVSFATNREPQLTTIPPDGDFMLTPPAEPDPLPIDPPPHDKAYFEAHMRGLSEFYRYQSGGRLHIEGRVLPDDPVGSYKLSDIADYGPGASGSWSLETLEQLVRDMIVAADEGAPADGVDLSDYDDDNPFTYVIFVHAGSDWQSDVYGDSPNDIPTFFISLGEPQPLTGGQLSECSIIPETTSQDDYPGSIAAAFYHEFGHALGLPDVYSTNTGLPAVGIWDLMDSGTNLPVTLGTVTAENDTIVKVATGVLPPSLSAWNKWFLGWIETEEVTNGSSDVQLPAVQVPKDQYLWYRGANPNFREDLPQAVRGGISPREWFLMENRWVPANPSVTAWDSLKFERDEDTGVILYLAGYRQGTWQNSGLYDYFLPAGGLLVWHVNMDRIEAGLADNTINADYDGLRLVEADGIQDVGVLDAYVIGWYGSYLDPFSELTGQQNLYVEGFPNTRCFDRSWTGLSVTGVRNLGMNDGVLRFAARVEPMAPGPGFPWETAPVDSAEAAALGGAPGARAVDPSSLTPLTVGGEPVMVFADAAPAGWSGQPWPAGLNGLRATGFARWASAAGRPFSEFARLSAPLAGPPAAWTEPDGSARLLCGTVDGQITLVTIPAVGQPAVAWSVDTGDSLRHGPLATGAGADRCLVLAEVHGGPDAGAWLTELDLADGAVVGTPVGVPGGWGEARPRRHVLADGERFAVFGPDRWHSVPVPGSSAATTVRHSYPREAEGRLRSVATDELVAVYDDRGLLGAWDASFAPTAAAPDPAAPLVGEPAVADLDGDGRQDVLLATAERVFAARPDGTPLRGFPVRLHELFPLADSTRIAGPLVVADADGDGVNEIVTTTDGGHLLGLTATGELRDRFPFRWGDRAGSGFAVLPATAADAGRTLWLASAGGYAGEPFGRNLTGGRLTALELAPAAAAPARTSEWLAAAGGPARGGPVGEARPLGAAAPAAAEAGRVVLYPNPVTGRDVTVRFTGAEDGDARVTLYNLEGEPVADATFPVTGGLVAERTFPLPGLASGLYVCRVQWPAGGGLETRTVTLAVER